MISMRGSRTAKEAEEMKSVHCQSGCWWRKRPDCKALSGRGISLVMLESPILVGTEEKHESFKSLIGKWLNCSLWDSFDPTSVL